MLLSRLLGEPLAKSFTGQRASGKDKRFALGKDVFGHLGSEEFASDGNVGVLLDLSGDGGGEVVAIHAEGGAAGDGMSLGSGDEQGAEGSHLGFELSGGGGGVLGFETVGADEFGEVDGFVGRSFVRPSHFIQGDF